VASERAPTLLMGSVSDGYLVLLNAKRSHKYRVDLLGGNWSAANPIKVELAQ
jgi:hypothetical protein